jgi:hypothetical protein
MYYLNKNIMEDINLINKKSRSNYWSSIVFLIVVIITTIILHIYNNSIYRDIGKIKMNIDSIDSSISEVEKDNNLQIYSLLNINKDFIKESEKMNKVTNYLNHMNDISKKYNISFS